MKSRLTLTRKILLGVVIVALAGVSTAGAIDKFTDVPDGKFYHDPVGWAADNGITTGTSPTTFEPERGVTRGESVTFLKRYDDNIVQPALGDTYTKAEVDAAIAAAAPEVYHAVVNADGTTRSNTSAGVSVAKTGTGTYEVEFPPADIRNCVYHATLVTEPTLLIIIISQPAPPDGQISLAEDFDGFLPAFADADSLFVQTDDSTGTAADHPFHLTIHC